MRDTVICTNVCVNCTVETEGTDTEARKCSQVFIM